MLSAIIALGPDNLIGTTNNTLPWEGEEFKLLRVVDMAIFKEFTIGKDILMGRKTWDSLNRKKLKGRNKHYIITSKPWIDKDPDIITFTLGDFIECILPLYENTKDKELVCIGGKQLFESLCLHFDVIILNSIECNKLENIKDGIYLKDYIFIREPFNMEADKDYYYTCYFSGTNKSKFKMRLSSIKFLRKTQ